MKLFYFFIILIILQSCSFDKKSGIWKDGSNPLKNKKSYLKDFKTVASSDNKFFNQVVKLDKKINFLLNPVFDNKHWDDIFYSKSNAYKNFLYNDKNKIIKKSKKLTRFKIDNNFLYFDNNIVATDSRGNLIIYSVENQKIVSKFNFYKKKFKNIEKKLNIKISNNILYVSDNIGYLYAYDYLNNKIIWAKNYKIPFRSNIKISNNKIFAADQNNNLFIINKENGDTLRQIPTEEILIKNDYKNNLSLSDNSLFFLNTFGSLFSISLNELKIKWVLNINRSLDTSLYNIFNAKILKYYNNRLVISTNTHLYVLNAESGTSIFKFPIIAKTNSVLFNKYIFLVNNKNLLVSFDLDSGKVLYSYSIDQKIANFLKIKKKIVKIKSLKLINNELYVFLENSYVVKFNINGEINSIIKLPQKIKSNPIFVNKNMLYIDQKNRLVILD